MHVSSTVDLANAIELAVSQAIEKLLKEVPEKFYYCTLFTTGEGLAPSIAAWSWETVEREVLAHDDTEEARLWLKWSWGDSPYLAYGDEFFDDVKKLFNKRPIIGQLNTEKEREEELRFRLNSMETALHNLDIKGIFGIDEERLGILINAEVFPPDYTNTESAIRLNHAGGMLAEWMKECAKPFP